MESFQVKKKTTSTVVKESNFSSISIDTYGIVQSFNCRAEEMLNYTAEEVVGKWSIERFHDKKELKKRAKHLHRELGLKPKSQFETIVAKAGKQNVPDEMECHYVRRDGYWVPVLLSVTALRDKEGKVNGYLCLAIDISDKKIAEEKLKASERRLKFALEGSQDGIWEWDIEKNELFLSTKVANLFGHPEKSHFNGEDSLSLFLHPEDISKASHLLKSHLKQETEIFEIEARWKIKTGNYQWMLTRGKVSECNSSGRPVRMTGVIINIEKLKYTEERWQNISQQYKNLFHGLNQSAIVAITDENGIIIYVNQKFTTISGYSKEELIGKSHHVVNSGHHSKDFFEKMWETISEGYVWRGEICNRKKSGEEYWVDSVIVPIKQSERNAQQYIAIRFEITERKNLEKALLKSKKEEERANQAKSTFLATMSHEIRTPLNGIIGMSNILKDMSLTHEQKEVVDTICQSGEALLSIVNDILDFSKIEAGKMMLEIIEFELGFYMKDLLKPFRYSAEEKNIQLDFQSTELPYLILGDPGRIGQIVSNLVSNAIKFTSKGSVIVKLEFIDQSDKVEALITVKDSGVGISTEAQNQIFSAFTQAEQSTSRKYGGTGLGLSISKHLVEMMNGTIQFESELGVGSTFQLKLPFKKGREATNIISSEINTPSTIDKTIHARILVAEDNITNQKVIGRMLEKLGHKFHLVANGIEAIDALSKANYDLILMDCQMPEMDGYEATRNIRNSLTSYRSIPIIALTAHASQKDQETCYHVGMNGYLTKPLAVSALDLELKRIFNLRKALEVA